LFKSTTSRTIGHVFYASYQYKRSPQQPGDCRVSNSKPAASDRRAAGPAIRSVRDFLSYRLSVLSRVLDRTTEARMMKASPLALTENRILGLFWEGNVTTVRAVAKEMCLDKAQVSRAMSKLVKQGLASRAIDPVDRRSAEFRITPRGREYYANHLSQASRRTRSPRSTPPSPS
jgi:DNA-binding MarR family transcriptional regulator